MCISSGSPCCAADISVCGDFESGKNLEALRATMVKESAIEWVSSMLRVYREESFPAMIWRKICSLYENSLYLCMYQDTAP